MVARHVDRVPRPCAPPRQRSLSHRHIPEVDARGQPTQRMAGDDGRRATRGGGAGHRVRAGAAGAGRLPMAARVSPPGRPTPPSCEAQRGDGSPRRRATALHGSNPGFVLVMEVTRASFNRVTLCCRGRWCGGSTGSTAARRRIARAAHAGSRAAEARRPLLKRPRGIGPIHPRCPCARPARAASGQSTPSTAVRASPDEA